MICLLVPTPDAVRATKKGWTPALPMSHLVGYMDCFLVSNLRFVLSRGVTASFLIVEPTEGRSFRSSVGSPGKKRMESPLAGNFLTEAELPKGMAN